MNVNSGIGMTVAEWRSRGDGMAKNCLTPQTPLPGDPMQAHLESNFLSADQPVVIACKGGFRSMMCVLRSRCPTVRRLTVGFDLR